MWTWATRPKVTGNIRHKFQQPLLRHLERRPLCCERSSSSVSALNGDKLVNWLESVGGSVRGVEIKSDGDFGWELRAAQDVTPGHRLVSLPLQCQLTYDAVSEDPRLGNLLNQTPAELWGARLALKLLAHRVAGADSFFDPYISLLPAQYPGIPLFFPLAAQRCIEYAPVSAQIVKRARWMDKFAREVLARLPSCPEEDPFQGVLVDINALGWAFAAVSSRAFRTRGPSHPASLLPLIDLANHSFDSNAEVLPHGDSVALFAKRKISAGEPILLNYGALSNDFFFMDYGFVLPNNPHDRVSLKFDPDLLLAGVLVSNLDESLTDGFPQPWQLKRLEALGCSAKGLAEVTLGGPEGIDPSLLAAARVIASKSEAADAGVEQIALKVTLSIVALALSRFSTGVKDDQELLASRTGSVLTAEERMAISFRMEKKKLLAACMFSIQNRMKGASGAPSPVVESVQKRHFSTKPQKSSSKGFSNKKK